jgi:hypothetical protein
MYGVNCESTDPPSLITLRDLHLQNSGKANSASRVKLPGDAQNQKRSTRERKILLPLRNQPNKGGEGGEGGVSRYHLYRFYHLPLPASVNRRQNFPHLRMLEHVLPQPVILLCASLGKFILSKRQMTVGKKAGRDSQGIG